jgi:hypothetical protein
MKMKNLDNSANGILWVGDKALETYQRTDKNVLKAFTNYVLLFDSTHSGIHDEATYLNKFDDTGHLAYESNSLIDPLQSYFSSIKINTIDLMIGSPYELLFQKIISMAKENDSSDENEIGKEEFQLFSFQHFRNRSVNEMDFRQKNVLLLSQDIPFSDMISDAKATQKKAKSTYNQTWTTLSENTEINEFLYRFSETPMEIDQCADVEQI